MKKKIIALALIGIPAFTFVMSYCLYHFFDNKKIEIRQKIDVKNNDLLSIYLETAEGSGEYKVSDDNVFPTEGYTFNETKSKCENGGSLSFDKSTGQVSMSATSSDKCYVYFDKGKSLFHKTCNDNTFACQIAKKFGKDSTLYLHDSALANGANDNSYRYAGAHNTVNNFVCFGTDAENCPNDNLYRIIGVFDNQVKLIKYDYATKEQLGTGGDYHGEFSPDTRYKGSLSKISRFYWNKNTSSNDWNESRLNTVNLNETYLNQLGTTWTDKIATTTWNVGGGPVANLRDSNAKTAYDYEVGANKINKTYEAKIGLMYVSDYYYGALPTHWTKRGLHSDSSKDYSSARNDNWMFMGDIEWTISPPTLTTTGVLYVYPTGHVASRWASDSSAIRPTFSLASNVELASGTGTKGDPFRIR